MSAWVTSAVYFSLVDSFSPRGSKDVFAKGISLNLTITEKCFFEPKINSQLGEQQGRVP